MASKNPHFFVALCLSTSLTPTTYVMPYDMPMWHNTLFRNQHSQPYYGPRLIRGGVLAWGNFLEDDPSQDCVTPTWKPIYNVTKPAAQDGDSFFLSPDFWMLWNKAAVRSRLSYPVKLKSRQSRDIWGKFCSSEVPLHLKDFIRKTLWKKLRVGRRLSKWIRNAPHCPRDRMEETLEHTLPTCRFVPFAFDTIAKCFLPIAVNESIVSSVWELFDNFLNSTFELPAGIMSWVAIMVNWDCRCAARNTALTWQRFMHLCVSAVKRLTRLQCPRIPVHDLSSFANSLSSLLNDGKLLHPRLNPLPLEPKISKAQARQRKFDNAVRDSHKLDALLDDLKVKRSI